MQFSTKCVFRLVIANFVNAAVLKSMYNRIDISATQQLHRKLYSTNDLCRKVRLYSNCISSFDDNSVLFS